MSLSLFVCVFVVVRRRLCRRHGGSCCCCYYYYFSSSVRMVASATSRSLVSSQRGRGIPFDLLLLVVLFVPTITRTFTRDVSVSLSLPSSSSKSSSSLDSLPPFLWSSLAEDAAVTANDQSTRTTFDDDPIINLRHRFPLVGCVEEEEEDEDVDKDDDEVLWYRGRVSPPPPNPPPSFLRYGRSALYSTQRVFYGVVNTYVHPTTRDVRRKEREMTHP